ncbi:SSI family serine proteinase inhibitor [Streptomyces sp. NPDC002476]|uniref:SSI family serine proteinase inhibitor n=1 Tax=Streptomyces sp. NPDC002476 TaxID=3364648 RepID=UPI0036BF4829
MLRRLALTAVVSLAVLSAAAPGAAAASGPLPLPSPLPLTLPLPLPQGEDDARTRLTVTVSEAGDPSAEGIFELECAPVGGDHPAAEPACDRLAELADEGTDPFAPVPRGAMCTQQFGGPATARITGTWRARHIDAVFSRADGCEISRWNNLRPVLPGVR